MAAKGTLFGKPRDEVVKRPGAFTAKADKALADLFRGLPRLPR
jgi:hypothetical protein